MTGEAGATPVEAVIARHTVKRIAYVGPILLLVFWLTRGVDGLVASAVGLAVVAGNFMLAGWMLSMAARISLGMYHAAALFGFFLRLALLMLTMLLIVQVVDIDRLAFGITAVVSYIVLLVLESVAVARGRERELDWIR